MSNPAKYRVIGEGGFEKWLRRTAWRMIHGGEISLRLAPSNVITKDDLIANIIARGLKELAGKR